MVCRIAASLGFCLLLAGQERIDSDVNDRIRQEAMENSRIRRTVHYLTDVAGPRLTGSPQCRAASEWAARQMSEWGLSDARLEPWDFGRHGWSNQRVAAFLTAPVEDTLVGKALPWTPGTDGTVTGQCVQLIPPENPVQEQFTAWIEGQREIVRDRIVLVGRHTEVPVNFKPPALRLEADLTLLRPAPAAQAAVPLTAQQIGDQIDRFLRDNRALVRVNDSARPLGQVRASQNRAYDITQVPPTLILRNEDFGRISRLLEEGLAVEMEVQIASRTHPEGRTAYNVLADIPGGDKRDEIVMLGGHIDSLDGATGATDNATGAAVMMEAARILKALGVQPRRTIRLALWGGEEQGLLGSQAHVREQFGTAESPKPAFYRLAACFNLDSGTGRIRGLSVFGPPAAAAALNEIVQPFARWGVAGAAGSRSRRLGGSDHTSFAAAGLPGIGLLQDPIEYPTSTWHTNLDAYERIVEDDLKQAAMVVASAVYHLAMREQILPRFAPWELPRPGTEAASPAAAGP
ncbi:MAG: M20/M25/M40 family metallo-hydrolase [Acidobacteria bacterium]|nr:M20/M25/M40 family metallo-hydrolase [Acidobacteriota bacterium]